MNLARACLERAFCRLEFDSLRLMDVDRHGSCNVRPVVFAITVALLTASGPATAEIPLHVRIDQSLAEVHPGPEVPLCTDGEFLRRIYLDLLGRIPTGVEARTFLEDKSADKRARIVNTLLDHADHPRHLAKTFDVMLMERRGHKHVKKEAWESYLVASFQQNKPLNQLAREILGADGVDEAQRAPAKFYLEREVEPNLLTREIGRMFFGMDVQCAQCHDHPSIDDYYQSDYYGLFAFVGRSYLFRPDGKKPAVLAEKADGDADFKSVFTEEEGWTLPRLPGSVEIDEPRFAPDEAYEIKPDPKNKQVRPIPKHSRRQALAARATDGSNMAFNRNLANRLWAHMMGRGLVHPVDQHHSANPPIQPQLLEMLAEELPQTNFDVKSMLRQIALTRTYQRRMDLPGDISPHANAASIQLESWNHRLEETKARVKQLRDVANELEIEYLDEQSAMKPLVVSEKKASGALAAARKTASDAAKAMSDTQESLEKQRRIQELLVAAADSAARAAQHLGDETIASHLKVIDNRRGQYDAKVAKQTEQLDTLTAANDAAKGKLAEAEKTSGGASTAVDQGNQKLRPLDASFTASKEALRRAQTELSYIKNQIGRLRNAVLYQETIQQRAALQQSSAEIESQTTALKANIAELTNKLERIRGQLPQAESRYNNSQKVADTAQDRLESARQAAGLLAASVTKAIEASQFLAGDATLSSALAALQSRSRGLEADITAQQDTLAKAITEKTAAAENVRSMREQMSLTSGEIAAAEPRLVEFDKRHNETLRQLAEATDSLQARRNAMATSWSEQFSIAVVQPLTAEQIAWSLLRTTGQIERQRASVISAIDKKQPLKPEEQKDAEKVAAREAEIEKQLAAKLDAIVDRFVKLFAAAGGQPQDSFFATVDQALFFRNGGDLRSWLSPTSNNFTARLEKIDDTRVLAEELYLGVLTRMPNDDEATEVAAYLATPEMNKRDAVQELAWALMTSAEFRFQH